MKANQKKNNSHVFSDKKNMLLAIAFLFFSIDSVALEEMKDADLSEVQGQDGLSLNIKSDLISANQLDFRFDEEAVTGGLESDALGFSEITMSASNGGHFDIQADVDVFAHDNGDAALALHTFWNDPVTLTATPQVRRVLNSSSGGGLQEVGGGALGEMALTTVGDFLMIGGRGFLDYGPNSRFMLNLGDVDSNDYSVNQGGALFYRQGSAELAFGDFGFLMDIQGGGLGADSDGLVLSGDSAKFNLTFNLLFDGAGSSPFSITAADQEMLRYGFSGGLIKPYLAARAGGARWSDGTITQGINVAFRSDFANDFSWVVGGSESYLKFNDWQKLQNESTVAPHFINVPYLAFDALNSGFSPESICWGADAANAAGNSGCGGSGVTNSVMGQVGVFKSQEFNFASTDVAQGIFLRDAALSAYSTSVEYYDSPTSSPIQEDWALIYTFGNVDANLLLYPQSTEGGAITADVLISSQTFDEGDQQSRWLKGTHFMIGDTEPGANLAIGFIGADLLFGAQKMTIALNSDGLSFSSNHARFALRGLFGGGPIPNMEQQQNIFHGGINIESDDVRLTLAPGAADNSLAYSGYLSLANLDSGPLASVADDDVYSSNDDGTYISLAEPSYDRLDVDIRFSDIRGDIQISNGQFHLKSNSGAPELTISNDLKVGSSIDTTYTNREALIVNRVEFGDKSLGSIVMPGGQLSASLTLKQQQ